MSVTRYDTIGGTYGRYRRPDRRIAAAIEEGLGDADSVLDVGSGTGSYQPQGRRVMAIDPSVTMIRQRPPSSAPVVRAVAECLPFGDGAFDAAMAVLTVHHWDDPLAGLRELQRVATRQVILTWDPAVFARFWFVRDYLPEIAEEERRLATLESVVSCVDVVDVRPVPVPRDCTDGFCGAYWGRPRLYLDPDARRAISTFARCPSDAVARAVRRLERDLEDGTWDRDHRELRGLEELDLGYRLVVAGRR